MTIQTDEPERGRPKAREEHSRPRPLTAEIAEDRRETRTQLLFLEQHLERISKPEPHALDFDELSRVAAGEHRLNAEFLVPTAG